MSLCWEELTDEEKEVLGRRFDVGEEEFEELKKKILLIEPRWSRYYN
jgi:hypothetical protein